MSTKSESSSVLIDRLSYLAFFIPNVHVLSRNALDFNHIHTLLCLTRHKRANREFSLKVHFKDTACLMAYAPKTNLGQMSTPILMPGLNGMCLGLSVEWSLHAA